ncbi:MAG: methionyl-tRNA formyltransferase [Clostridiales bacterium]|nr:methionyl-tRNA formyltransferase [Clostridiales bacterium]
MRIAFLGTPEFALPSLAMLKAEGHELEVFTQPDRPKDRGHGLAMPPVKVFALENGIPVFQFERIRGEEGVSALRDFAPDLMVTAAFGQILSAENLAVPKYGCINVHGSLLPKYRGAAPIQWAVVDGEKTTGVTTMMTDIGLDTGDILLKAETAIGEDETAGELYERLAVLGADLLKETICRLEEGTLLRTPQDEEMATRCGVIKKYMAEIDFGASCCRVHDLVRGMNPAPTAFTKLNGQAVKVYKTVKHPELAGEFTEASVGECVIADSRKGLFVKCADGVIEIAELQFAGSKRMETKAALNSRKLLGAVLGV